MTEHGNPHSAPESHVTNNAKSGIKFRFANLRSSVTNTADAAKVLTRLAPKQIKDEVQIAKLELKTKGIDLGKGAAVAAVGAVFGLFLIIALIAAAILGLGKVMEPWLAALVLALIFLILLAIFALVGVKMIKKQLPFKPESALFGLLYDLGVLKHGSEMTSARLKREQAEKAAQKEAEKKAAAEEAENQAEDSETPAASEEQLKLRTKQRREHLKALRDDIDNYSNEIKNSASGLVRGVKESVQQAPSHMVAGSRRLGENAADRQTLKTRWGSFTALIASVGAFFVFLGKLIRRRK